MKNYEVSEQLLREVYNDGSDELKAKLADQFPDVFSEVFYFGKQFTITTAGNTPLFIGFNLPPLELKNKCLVINPRFEMVTFNYSDHTMLKFTKK